jgi:hypothetical protein
MRRANPKLTLANPKQTLANPKRGVGVIFSQSATRLRPKRFGPNFTTPQPHFGGRFDPNRLLIVPRVNSRELRVNLGLTWG